MQNLPKINDLKSPEGYFEELPDRIMSKIHKKENYPWIKWAASVVFILGIGIWQFTNSSATSDQVVLDEEIDLYIDSQYWTAEDILSMSENPDEILNEIMLDENPFIEDISSDQEDIWF